MASTKIGKISYRQSPMNILANSKLGKAFRAYCDRSCVEEIIEFPEEKRFDPKNAFPYHFAKKSKVWLNISNDLLAQAEDLAAAATWLRSARHP